MTNAPISRSALTKTLFEHLAGTLLMGRGVAPPSGGWTTGQPNTGAFTDYAVLKTGRATTPAPGEPERLARMRTSWRCTYQVTYHSTSDSKVDDLADIGRATLVTLTGPLTLDGVEWTLEKIEVPALGSTERDDSTDPAHWRVTDDVSLHLSRVQTR